MTRAAIYAAIDAERVRQAEKWGPPHPWGQGDCSSLLVDETVKVAVLAEECGEVARAVLDARHGDMRRELVQVAAVAVAWLEAFDEEGPTLWES
jgi:NTP pyrophosphatase (non-canonical NTP hydrolase)